MGVSLLRSYNYKLYQPRNTMQVTSRLTNEAAKFMSGNNDNWIETLAINHLSHKLQATTGLRSKNSGYDGLVETAVMVTRRFTPSLQRKLVLQSLEMAFPRPLLFMIKSLLPPSKFTRELFALFTVVFFRWLVGSCEVRAGKSGEREKNVVHITKCRVLERTNCVGVCINLCKIPCQIFINNSLGIPVTMSPKFEDMSCQMVFGEEPLPESSDPALTAPCYDQCGSNKKSHKTINCTK